ncbi:MAG: hypothetical protein ABIJ75_07815, partial [Actinomycetota bacterium]
MDTIEGGGVAPHLHEAEDISGGVFTQVLVGGDIFSSNWDGAVPADLSSGPDAAATEGFYLDSSADAIQAQRLYAEGGLIGGWTVGAATLTGGSASLSSTGVLSLGTADDVAVVS